MFHSGHAWHLVQLSSNSTPTKWTPVPSAGIAKNKTFFGFPPHSTFRLTRERVLLDPFGGLPGSSGIGNGIGGMGEVGPTPHPHSPSPAGGRPAHCGSLVVIGAPKFQEPAPCQKS